MPVAVSLNGGADKSIPYDDAFVYEKDLVDLLKIYPSEGPASGGSRVTLFSSVPFTVRGAARDQFACRFGDVSVKAIDANATHVTCVSPPGRGAVRVAVSSNSGVDFDAKTAAPYAYRKDASIQSLEPSWGPSGGGTRVRVRGSSFARGSDVRCRFGDRESTAEWHSENLISCASPALQPEMEVQSIAVVSAAHIPEVQQVETSAANMSREVHTIDMYSVDGFAPVAEVQRLELEYTRAVKAEIQDVEIRAHAAQGPALVELKVDTNSEEGQVQRLSVRAPFRREVQRLIMAPLLGANRAPAEDAAP